MNAHAPAPVAVPSLTDQAAPRVDFEVIRELIEPGTRILDVGCGDGELMALLSRLDGVRAQGIELSQAGVNRAVARGLSVVQGDADTDLDDYPAGAFDYVILSQTLQATRDPRKVTENLLRIGRRAIVSFPNFGFWRLRFHLLFLGTAPVPGKPGRVMKPWYQSEEIHPCTIRDFVDLTGEMDAEIKAAIALNGKGARISFNAPWWFWNLFGEQAVFLLER